MCVRERQREKERERDGENKVGRKETGENENQMPAELVR